MRKVRVLPKKVTILFLIVLLLLVPAQSSFAQEGDTRYQFFQETGHAIQGDFFDFFQAHGGLSIFGYPITERFEQRGVWVQYFQNARLEEHPENAEPYKVQLGLLGDELNLRQSAVAPPQFPTRRRFFFRETGHIVSYAFLEFFEAHNDLFLFGYPISEMYFQEDGRIVQVFQRLKLEWCPEDSNSPVHVGNLGEVYVAAYGDQFPAEAWQPPGPRTGQSETPVPPAGLTSIRALVALRYSVMGEQDSQTVAVLTTDDKGKPLENARIAIHFVDAAGQTFSTVSDLVTDQRGFVRVSVPVTGGKTGEQVVVRVAVTYGTLQGSAESVFLLWR